MASDLDSYMKEYLRKNSPNGPLVETLRQERANHEQNRLLKSQAEGLERLINKIRDNPKVERHEIGFLTNDQIMFLTGQGITVMKSDRMKHDIDCYYVSLD